MPMSHLPCAPCSHSKTLLFHGKVTHERTGNGSLFTKTENTVKRRKVKIEEKRMEQDKVEDSLA
jgi:hypothetical protein